MSVQISDMLNKLVIQKDPVNKLIKISFMEDDRAIVLNKFMWAVINSNKVIGENWDLENLKPNLTNYDNLTDIAVLTKIKNRCLHDKLDDKFINLLLVLCHYSF
jgi:hypothetical protein